MANSTRRIGVVLFQLGGPDTLEAVEPFLFNLFSDPDIIDFPGARLGRKAVECKTNPLGQVAAYLAERPVPHRRVPEQQPLHLGHHLVE